MKNMHLYFGLVITLFTMMCSSGMIEEEYFSLDVTNYTTDEVVLVANGAHFDRVKPGESKIPDDIFEYDRLFHFVAFSIDDGSIKSSIYVTVS